MQQNKTSMRMKKQNMLKTKVQMFKQTFLESEKRMKSTSSIQNLAGKLYSNSNNRQFTRYSTKSQLHTQRPPSPSQGQGNPEKQKTIALKGLQMRASHVVSYAQINTDLLKQKERLELLIKSLKENIAKQNKKLNEADYNLKKYTNQKDHAVHQYNDAHARSERLQDQINQTQQDINLNKGQRNELKSKLQSTKNIKQMNINRCKELEESVKRLKQQLSHQDKIRTNIKAQLAKQLKIMSSCSIYTKQLENERANVLLEINKFVQNTKI